MDEKLPQYTNFGSSEALLAYIKERSDDLEKVVILTGSPVLSYGGRPVADLSEFGLALYFVGGGRELIKKPDAQLLLNDGILNRMGIKIEMGG